MVDVTIFIHIYCTDLGKVMRSYSHAQKYHHVCNFYRKCHPSLRKLVQLQIFLIFVYFVCIRKKQKKEKKCQI